MNDSDNDDNNGETMMVMYDACTSLRPLPITLQADRSSGRIICSPWVPLYLLFSICFISMGISFINELAVVVVVVAVLKVAVLETQKRIVLVQPPLLILFL